MARNLQQRFSLFIAGVAILLVLATALLSWQVMGISAESRELLLAAQRLADAETPDLAAIQSRLQWLENGLSSDLDLFWICLGGGGLLSLLVLLAGAAWFRRGWRQVIGGDASQAQQLARSLVEGDLLVRPDDAVEPDSLMGALLALQKRTRELVLHLQRETELTRGLVEARDQSFGTMAVDMEQSVEQSRQAVEPVQQALQVVTDAGGHLQVTERAMGQLQQSSDQLSNTLIEMRDLAVQIELVAVNAAVEQARLGDGAASTAALATDARQQAAALIELCREAAALLEEMRSVAEQEQRNLLVLQGLTDTGIEQMQKSRSLLGTLRSETPATGNMPPIMSPIMDPLDRLQALTEDFRL